MKRGDIYLLTLDPSFGHEQQGRRPVLIVSADAFNQLTKLPVVVPITSGGNFAKVAGFTVSLDKAGTKTAGVIRCDQPRIVDLKAAQRNARKLESVPDEIIEHVLAKLVPIFK